MGYLGIILYNLTDEIIPLPYSLRTRNLNQKYPLPYSDSRSIMLQYTSVRSPI